MRGDRGSKNLASNSDRSSFHCSKRWVMEIVHVYAFYVHHSSHPSQLLRDNVPVTS